MSALKALHLTFIVRNRVPRYRKNLPLIRRRPIISSHGFLPRFAPPSSESPDAAGENDGSGDAKESEEGNWFDVMWKQLKRRVQELGW